MSFAHHCRHHADRVGIWLSGLCLLHCALTPLILLGLPALSLLKLGESLHQALAVILPAVALVAFVPGYRRHRRKNLIFLGLAGLMLIVGAALLEGRIPRWAEALASICGSLMLVRAHWQNQKLHVCGPAEAR